MKQKILQYDFGHFSFFFLIAECTSSPQMLNSRILNITQSALQILFAECIAGYIFGNGENINQFTCQSDGTWESDPIRCFNCEYKQSFRRSFRS